MREMSEAGRSTCVRKVELGSNGRNVSGLAVRAKRGEWC